MKPAPKTRGGKVMWLLEYPQRGSITWICRTKADAKLYCRPAYNGRIRRVIVTDPPVRARGKVKIKPKCERCSTIGWWNCPKHKGRPRVKGRSK